jgi:hypothetical protein
MRLQAHVPIWKRYLITKAHAETMKDVLEKANH